VSLKQIGYPFPVYSLFTWNQKTEALVRPLLHSFKGGRAFRATRLFADALAYETACEIGSSLAPPCFVHPPSSGPSRNDHSWLLTSVLSAHWPGTGILCLKQKDGELGSQKGKTAQERRLKRYERVDPCENFSSPGTSWIFVDDVITSGSTAMAAYMALGDPDRFTVLSLICRPKLAGKSAIW
jgi:predicted amidophosphoribosyltransferase